MRFFVASSVALSGLLKVAAVVAAVELQLLGCEYCLRF